MKVAIVEDDKYLAEAISSYLKSKDLETITYQNYTDVMKHVKRDLDIAIVDLNLGDGDGMHLISELHLINRHTKVIIITGYDSLPKRLQSFYNGADDYMKKPIFPSELYLRLMRLKKNIEVSTPADPATLNVYSKKEVELLKLFLAAKGGAISLEYISSTMSLSTSAVYTLLSRLKTKCRGSHTIKSAYGRGWYLKTMAVS